MFTSHENPILVQFRDNLDTIINPNVGFEAGWWVSLIEIDPLLMNANYWGKGSFPSLTDTQIEHAYKVLERLATLGGN